jgi:hypothetical protein
VIAKPDQCVNAKGGSVMSRLLRLYFQRDQTRTSSAQPMRLIPISSRLLVPSP